MQRSGVVTYARGYVRVSGSVALPRVRGDCIHEASRREYDFAGCFFLLLFLRVAFGCRTPTGEVGKGSDCVLRTAFEAIARIGVIDAPSVSEGEERGSVLFLKYL